MEELKTKSNSPKKRMVCHYPWSSIYVLPNGDVKHCCESNLTKLGNLTENTIEEIWNGKQYQMVRKKIAAGDFDGAYCNPYCQGIRTGLGYPWHDRTYGSKEMEENESRAIYNLENNIEKVDHFPTQLHLEFSNNCNLRCIMCLYEFKPPYSSIPESVVEQILAISKYATLVVLIGGEVFMNKSDLEFMDKYNSQDGAWMGFVSNGTFLDDKMIEKIKKYKIVGLQISIDGSTKEVYEKIRLRGKWEVTDANIRRFVKASEELKEKGYKWELGLAFVVMRSNFDNISHSIRYAAEMNVIIDFNPLIGYNFFYENIYVYKDALEALGDWRSQINHALKTLEEYKGQYKHYDRVYTRLKDIEQLLLGPKIRIRPWMIKFLNFVVPGKKDSKTQGLSRHDSRVGHIMEIYYSWKTGKTSFWATFSYFFMKFFKVLKEKFLGKKK